MAGRRLTHGALEQERLVRELQWVAVREVDLELRNSRFMAQRPELDLLGFAEVVDVVDERVVLVQRVDAVGLAAPLRLSRSPLRRPQRIVRVGVALDEVELELRCDNGPPAMLPVEIEHSPQHVAGGRGHRCAVGVEAIVDDLRGRLRRPRYQSDRALVGVQHDVAIRWIDRALVLGIVSGDGLQDQRFGEVQAEGAAVRRDRHDLAAGDPGHVGHQRLDLGDRALPAPAFDMAHGAVGSRMDDGLRRSCMRVHDAIRARTVSPGAARRPACSRHAAPNAVKMARETGSFSAFHSGCH